MKFEQESDMKAAKLMDIKWVYGVDNKKIYYESLDGETPWEVFTLSDKATQMDVVQMLGEKFNISIVRYSGQDGDDCWYADDVHGSGLENCPTFDTYIETVRHAVMEVE